MAALETLEQKTVLNVLSALSSLKPHSFSLFFVYRNDVRNIKYILLWQQRIYFAGPQLLNLMMLHFRSSSYALLP